ncbi:C40 family peptidase [Neomicrococcus lactis]|uniref:C40 family peptidase n=1 Tax=Neomicrococcus lactis TaxID=732241 RepID=UPI0023018511|nr:C40 family peptidase [Neomicrococcus lactis]
MRARSAHTATQVSSRTLLCGALLCGMLISAPAASAETANLSWQQSLVALPAQPQSPAQPAVELPSATEIARAKALAADPKSRSTSALKALVSRLDQALLDSETQLAKAESDALSTLDAQTAADEAASTRTKTAQEARLHAAEAQASYEALQKSVGKLAGDLYRQGGVNPALSALFNSSNNNDVIYKASTLDALTANRAQTLTASKAAADLAASWQNYASGLESVATKASDIQHRITTAALESANRYEAQRHAQEETRAQILALLAEARGTSVSDESKRADELIAAHNEEALQAALASTPHGAAQDGDLSPGSDVASQTLRDLAALDSESNTTTPLPRPADVPDVAPVANSLRPVVRSTPAAPALNATQTATPERPSTPAQPSNPTQPSVPAQPSVRAIPSDPAEPTRPTQAASSSLAQTPPAPTQAPEPTRAPAPTVTPQPTRTATPTPTPTRTAIPKPAPAPAPTTGSKEAAIAWAIATANNNSIGYSYGANGPNYYDCSSFAKTAFALSGVTLPRTSSSQYFNAPTKVPLSQLRRGDLVFWSSNGGASMYHVAIYLGDGMIVHARNPQMGISVTPLNYGGMDNVYPYAGRY